MSAARIKNKPVRFLSSHDQLVENLREEIRRLRNENMQLRSSLSTAPPMLSSSNLGDIEASSYRIDQGDSLNKQSMGRVFSVPEVIDGREVRGFRSSNPKMKGSKSMMSISNKRLPGKNRVLPGNLDRFLPVDEDLFMADTQDEGRMSTGIMEDDNEDDSSSVGYSVRSSKVYEPVLRARRGFPTKKKKPGQSKSPKKASDLNFDKARHSDIERKVKTAQLNRNLKLH